MVEGVKGVVLCHRTLLLMDWLLSAFAGIPFHSKVQLAGCFTVYSLAVEYLTNLTEHVLGGGGNGPRGGRRGMGARLKSV